MPGSGPRNAPESIAQGFSMNHPRHGSGLEANRCTPEARVQRSLPVCLALLAIGCAQPPASGNEPTPERAVASLSTATVDPAPAMPLDTRRQAPRARRELTWRFTQAPFGETDVVISVPAVSDAEQRFPVLVAFHGRGESLKGSREGARGWLDDYQLGRATERLASPPLGRDDFEGFVTPERLSTINAGLQRDPYQGLIVVCPFLPDVLKGEEAFESTPALASFVVDALLPRVFARLPAIAEPSATGIDGVSLGGRAALLVGLSRPEAFGGVAGLQPALDRGEIERFAELARSARAQNPGLALRLLTSDEDYFLAVTRRFSRALSERGVEHELATVKGTHSYRFNRGPGAYEMLLFHDRVLRGKAPL
jgi:enterochelin esterase-like enzyme